MGEVVNLRQVRKARARAEAEAVAAGNRQKYGRTKTERKAREAERLQGDRHLEGHRLEKPED